MDELTLSSVNHYLLVALNGHNLGYTIWRARIVDETTVITSDKASDEKGQSPHAALLSSVYYPVIVDTEQIRATDTHAFVILLSPVCDLLSMDSSYIRQEHERWPEQKSYLMSSPTYSTMRSPGSIASIAYRPVASGQMYTAT